MFKKALLSTFFLISFVNAQSIDDLVKSALEKNNELKSLEKSIEIASKDIELSSKWNNPTVSLGITDVQSDISNRSIEPMQAYVVGVTQVIPITDKLKFKKDVALKDKNLASLQLEDAKIKYSSLINQKAYTLLILKKKLKLLLHYKENLIGLEELTKALYKASKATQNDIINTQILKDSISLKIENIKDSINRLTYQLEQLSYTKVDSLTSSLLVKKSVLKTDVNRHPKIKMLNTNKNRLLDIAKLEDAKKNSDLKFNMSYFKRADKFNDYMNFSIAIPLSLYGREDIKIKKANLQADGLSNKTAELVESFKAQISILQSNLNTSYNKIKILRESIIPKKKAIQNSLEAYNSFSQVKPEKTIKNLNEIITYEIQLLDELNNYFNAYSKSIYYTGRN